MKRNRRSLALLAALALLLSLLTACGGGRQNKPEPSPAPAEDTEPAQSPETPSPAPAETTPNQPETQEPADAQEPEDTQEPADAAQPGPEDGKPEEEPAPEETQPPEPVSAPADPGPGPEPTPEPEPEPDPEPAETVPEDGTYTAAVKLEGGTGRATVESPAALHCKDGRFTAVIVWSSPNFDYMKVDGEKYELISEPGANSTFEIPVSAFDQPLSVIADTVAMSEPHEVEYTLYFDSATLQKQ